MKRWLGFSQLARTNRRNESRAGYTIIEVLVVLTVSTMLFVAISVTLSGRQAKVEFNQGVRDYESKIQTIASDVSKGYEATTTGGNDQSTIFLGKIIESEGPDTDVLTIIGNRNYSGTTVGNDVRTLTEAAPRAAAPAVTVFHDFGLRVHKVLRLDGTTTEYGAFGFIHRLSGSLDTQSSSLVQLYAIPNTTVPVGDVSSGPNLAQLIPIPEGLLICLRGPDPVNQRAEIRLGAGNSQTTFISEIDTKNNGGLCNV